MSMVKIVDGKKVKHNIENTQHYFSTPKYIADIMAEKVFEMWDGVSEIVDIGAGLGELTAALMKKGVPGNKIVMVDVENRFTSTGSATFIQADFLTMDISPYKYFIMNPPYKNGLHKKFADKVTKNKMKGCFIAPCMVYHNVKTEAAKYIKEEIWDDQFRKDFKLPSTQISIFVVDDKQCNDGEKLKSAYFGEHYDLFNANYPICKNSIKSLPVYDGQPNSLVFNPNNIWAAPAEFMCNKASFIYDRPARDEKLIIYDRSGAHFQKGALRNYPCMQYRDEEHKKRIIEFYRPLFDCFRKFIVIDVGRFIPIYEGP